MKIITKPIRVEYRYDKSEGTIQTTEGIEHYNKDDVVITSPHVYCMNINKFNKKFKIIDDIQAIKRKQVLNGTRLTKNTELKTDWGTMKGKKGDYLVYSPNNPNDKWIVPFDTFIETYYIDK